MTSEETKKLQHIVERYAQLSAEIAAAREEQKELAATAWEPCEVPAKVLRQLAKEMSWTELERLAQRQLEERLDQCRAALGLLRETPLGEGALQRAARDAAAPTAPRP